MGVAALGFLFILWGIAAIISSFRGVSFISEFESVLKLGGTKK